MPTIWRKVNESLEATAVMIDRHYPDRMPSWPAAANENITEAERINAINHNYIMDMIKELFSYIRVMPDDMAIAELEAVAAETDQTVNSFKEKSHGQSSQKTN